MHLYKQGFRPYLPLSHICVAWDETGFASLLFFGKRPLRIECAHLSTAVTPLLIKTDRYTMIADSILQFTDLQELCRPGKKPRLSTVARGASSQGIKYRYDGKGGIWTTTDALN